MTQEEKLLARIRTLPEGVTTIQIGKNERGELMFWLVGETAKLEGQKKEAVEPKA
jgi:hypothetical protein